MNKLLLTLIFFSSLHFYSLGQIKKYPVAFPTPNVASFGRIEDPEVDLCRGTPNISIPLFNLTGQQLSTDIALNYDASGVRPENHPGVVGQNFQMIVSGAISRSVQGYPDELDNKICARMGFYYTGSALKTEDWASLDNIKKYTKLSLTDLFAVVWEGGAPCNPRIPNQIDTEPDIFVFNIGNNISGKFFFDENQQIKVQCSRKVQVIFDPADFIDNHLKSFTTVNTAAPLYSKTFGRFTIIDENGTKYTFGNNAIEYSDVPGALMFRQGSDCEKPVSQLTKNRGFFCYATTWYLESVSTSDDT
ncbi:hypothetical protein, partial [Ohtaekwangia sp.]|uniref:hypothetical protein n=1 Tax=Ohtaekwangia sp. TaxID=2066019 RepID=UPI002FDDC7F1